MAQTLNAIFPRKINPCWLVRRLMLPSSMSWALFREGGAKWLHRDALSTPFSLQRRSQRAGAKKTFMPRCRHWSRFREHFCEHIDYYNVFVIDSV